MRAMGIDIGTTTVSVLMLESETGEMLGSRTVSHKAFVEGKHAFNRVQDPEKLFEITAGAAAELAEKYGKPDSIGFTGQMHGMLYVDKNGKAVSPLYTWQDGSGNEEYRDGETYAQFLKKNIGAAATGYGMTSHFYLGVNGEIPEDAVKMTTISDYIAMRFCDLHAPVLAKDMAASWGCFDIKKGEFYTEKLEAAGVKTEYIPTVRAEHEIIGKAALPGLEGVPVMSSLGDNQASFIGSVQSLKDTILVNIGTGSQVSFGTGNFYQTEGAIELRPCTEDSYILAGAGLCGGRAYAMLEEFYSQILKDAGVDAENISMYRVMEKQAGEYIEKNGMEAVWKIRTTFSGTRSNPEERGSISSISVENFAPGAMTAGMILGILNELYEMYQAMCEMTGNTAVRLVGSGNGIRQNKVMQELAERLFGMKLNIPKCQEEAAYGAALHSLVSAGLAGSLEEVQQKIQYINKIK